MARLLRTALKESPEPYTSADQPQESDILSAIPIHSRVLQYGVGLGPLRIPPVVTDKEVLDGDSSTKLVAANEKIVWRSHGDILVGLAIYQFDRDSR